jgi:hypothetical protein
VSRICLLDLKEVRVARWAWRAVRTGTVHESSDRAYNERLAGRLLCSGLGDDLAIALDQVGWRIAPLDGSLDRWPMSEASRLTPSWAVSVREQERAITDGMAALDGSGRGSGRRTRTL